MMGFFMEIKPDFSGLKENLPPIIPRSDIQRYLGNLFSPGYLENLDSAGRGPKRIRINKRICYLREDFLSWLEARAEFLA